MGFIYEPDPNSRAGAAPKEQHAALRSMCATPDNALFTISIVCSCAAAQRTLDLRGDGMATTGCKALLITILPYYRTVGGGPNSVLEL